MSERALVFRLNEGQGPELIRQVFLERGWKEFDEDEDDEWNWNLWWRSSRFRTCDYNDIYPWQRLNHYPKSTAITKKDSLARNLKRMKAVYGASVYNFSPLAFNLPNDYTKFVGLFSKSKDKEKKEHYWICKPADMSRGRGIFLFRDLSELQYDCNAVVQEYIPNPMLISGYKFDLRIYVLVPSFHPLQIYIYQEGLVRFSTEKFDLNTLGNMYSHLTNTSINKHGPSYNLEKERVGPGCKWTITQLRHFFRQTLNINDNELWGKIINIVILTLLVQVPQVPKANNCFELYGFDILVDDKLKPWLLEVNFSPALSSDCQTDIIVKKPMLHDMIEMMHFTEIDMLRGERFTRNNPSRTMSLPAEKHRKVSQNYTSSAFARRPPSKLPDLQHTFHAPSVSTVSHFSGSMTDDDPYNAFHSDVVPLVPGCGLPSVQQSVSYYQRCSSDSGRSSASPDLMDPYPRIPAIKSETNNQARSKQKSSSKVPSNSVQHGVRPQTLTSLTKTGLNKMEPVSDSSGVSSFSASSENSETLGCTSLSKQSMGRHTNSTSRLSHAQSVNNAITKSVNSIENDMSMDINGNVIKPVTHKNMLRRDFRLSGAKPKATSFSTRASKSLLINSTKSHATQQKLAAYAKPWKERSAEAFTENQNLGLQPLASCVGNFILVWPFNEVTRKCSINPDPRIVIRECQKVFKERTKVQPQLWGPLTAVENS